ncbi:MAG: L,D-transpeptidase [Xanthobacteraceae bacterium]|nr:L,D-transpeptidase [Xanthobacteraceae bacterium]
MSRTSIKPRARAAEKSEARDRKSGRTSETALPPPAGPLHIIVSIGKQRATLFDDGVPIASTAISTSTPSHPTPTGVFTIIQKSRHHVSNLYGAAMPYMQRITWSGSALHQGPLPGYPASHGCVRLTTEFAQRLWTTTKMSARVIVTRDEVAPVPIEHARLFVPRPAKVVEAPAVTSALVRTADAANATAGEQIIKTSATDGIGSTAEAAKPAETSEPATPSADAARSVEAKPAQTRAAPAPIVIDERPATMPAAIVKEAGRRPVSVFVSLKEGKLYVRQGWQPLFETPVTFEQPDQPIGTHVYTAMGLKAGGKDLRWTVVSIPSRIKPKVEPKASKNSRKPRNERAVKIVEAATPLPSASAALDRIVMPPDAVERISKMMMSGSSLIVSDNKLSDETGAYTDFIVLTR